MGVADIDDFDIDKSIAAAWAEFQARLSEVVSMIDESGDLTIGTGSGDDEETPFLRLSSPRPHLVRGEAASNAVLGEDYQLGPEQLATMERLGWQPPSVEGDHPTAHFWVECDQDDADRISELAVGALRDVYGVQHPVFLAPDQLAEVLQPGPARWRRAPAPWSRRVPDLSATMPRNQPHLNQLVDVELGRMFGYPPMHDTEGDVAIRVGRPCSSCVPPPDAQEVVVFAAVVHDVAGRSRAAEVLNDLNVEARWVKFQLVRDRVFVTVSVLARPFVPAHLHHAVKILAETADGIDNELAVKLGGRTTFDDHDEDAPDRPAVRRGRPGDVYAPVVVPRVRPGPAHHRLARRDRPHDREHQVVVVAGETGSGKTTQLPKICLELGRRSIGHTQPRRIAARTVAERVAEELGTELGDLVGYQVRFTGRRRRATRVKVMTDGMLLAEIGRDRDLRRYDTIIIDEAHERSLNIDFLLGYLRRLLAATTRPQGHHHLRHHRHRAVRRALRRRGRRAPIIEVSGRTYPVEIRYRPPPGRRRGDEVGGGLRRGRGAVRLRRRRRAGVPVR